MGRRRRKSKPPHPPPAREARKATRAPRDDARVPTPPERTAPRRRRSVAPLVIAAGAGAALLLWALSRGSSIEPRPLNVVLVTADTLRADKLGAYGNARVSTPHLDRLAESGVLFESATTVAPITLPAHASLFTGTYPIFHGVRDNGGNALPSERATLAEILRERGYATGGFVGAFVLDSRWGLDQGFDRYFDDFDSEASDSSRRGDEVLAEALAWMESVSDRRFFSWIHLFDPHVPYDPPEPFRSRYPNDPVGLYDGEVSYVDSLVGRLLDWLDEKGLEGPTIFLFVADHGESLGDHGELTHGFFVYDATMQVPLLLRAPNVPAKGARISAQVRTIDLLPTILELLGIEPSPEAQGASLVPLLASPEEDLELAAYGESSFPAHYGWSPLESLRTRERLFVSAPRPELYEGGGERNLANERAQTVGEMQSRLDEIRARFSAAEQASPAPPPLDDETRQRLTALGYLGESPRRPADSSEPLADPKDKIELFSLIREASADADEGRPEEAIDKLQRVSSEDPEILEVHNLLGRIHAETGDHESAELSYREALLRDASYVPALFGLASVYEAQGKTAEAMAGLERVVELEPRLTEASLRLARLYVSEKRFEDTLGLLERLEDPEGTSAARYELMAEAHLGMQNAAAAVEAYENALEASPESHMTHYNLAKLLGQLGRQDEMLAHLEASIEAEPGFAVGHLYLANTYLDRGEPERAVELAKKGIELGPDPELVPFGHFILADAYNQLGRTEEAAREMERAQRLRMPSNN